MSQNAQSDEDSMLTVQEVAKMLRVSAGTVRTLVSQGELKGPKVLTQQRILRSSYDDYVKRHTVEES